MPQLQTAIMDKEGRVQIPKIVIKQLGLAAPATLVVTLERDTIMLKLHEMEGAELHLRDLFQKLEHKPDETTDPKDRPHAQSLPQSSNDELHHIMDLLGIDDDGDAPETIVGLIKDYATEDEDSLDIVRSIRHGD